VEILNHIVNVNKMIIMNAEKMIEEVKETIKAEEDKIRQLMIASGFLPNYDKNKAFRTNENKLRYDLCPAIAQREYAKVWTQGLEKYPARNWEKGFLFSEVIASAMRHLEAIRLGQEIDEESGLLHSAHLMANAAMLTEFYFTHPELNDLKK
jgi:hypothetical protein